MRFDRIRRWQWLLISVAVGFAIPWAHKMAGPPDLARLGHALNSQNEFDRALLHKVDGRARFDHIRLMQLDALEADGHVALRHVVTGEYCAPLLPGEKDHKWVAAFYVPKSPYTLRNDTFDHDRKFRADFDAEYGKIANPTIRDFLDTLGTMSDVRYTYEWWRDPRYEPWVWLAASIVFLGLALPSAIYYAAYRSIFQPKFEKRVKLAPAAKTPEAPKPQVSAAEQAKVAAMADAMEARLQAGAGQRGPDGAAAAEAAPAVQALTGGPLEASAQAEREATEFGTKKDDYYPVEQRKHN